MELCCSMYYSMSDLSSSQCCEKSTNCQVANFFLLPRPSSSPSPPSMSLGTSSICSAFVVVSKPPLSRAETRPPWRLCTAWGVWWVAAITSRRLISLSSSSSSSSGSGLGLQQRWFLLLDVYGGLLRRSTQPKKGHSWCIVPSAFLASQMTSEFCETGPIS